MSDHTFSDNFGRSYRVTIDQGTKERLREILDIDCDALARDFQQLADLIGDPTALSIRDLFLLAMDDAYPGSHYREVFEKVKRCTERGKQAKSFNNPN